MSKRIIKIVNISLTIIYIFVVSIIAINFDLYSAIYPEYEPIYLLKLCVSAVLLGFLVTPCFKLNTKLANIYYIILWLSMLSIIPDIIRCIPILMP